MIDAKSVGEIIKGKRLEKGLTQKQLASLLFVENTTISRWECGLGFPSVNLLDKICKILDLNYHELFGDDFVNQKQIDAQKQNFKTKTIIECLLNIASLIIALFLIITLFFSEMRGNIFFLSKFISKDYALGLFLLITILNIATLILDIINLALILLKKKRLVFLYPLMLLISICTVATATIIFLMNDDRLYFGLISFLSTIVPLLFLEAICFTYPFSKILMRIIVSILLSALAITLFVNMYAIIYFSVTSLSSVLLQIAVYFPIVIFNTSGMCLLLNKYSTKKNSLIVTLSVFGVLNLLFFLRFTNLKFLEIPTTIFFIIGILSSPLFMVFPGIIFQQKE